MLVAFSIWLSITLGYLGTTFCARSLRKIRTDCIGTCELEDEDNMCESDHIEDLIVAVMSWHCPSGFQFMICPYPGAGMVGVLLNYRKVICEVPVGCVCCAHARLDCTVQQLVRQADPDLFEDSLQLAGVKFEQAIEEMKL